MDIRLREYNGVPVSEKERLQWAHILYEKHQQSYEAHEELHIRYMLSGDHLVIGFLNEDHTIDIYDCMIEHYWCSGDMYNEEILLGPLLLF